MTCISHEIERNGKRDRGSDSQRKTDIKYRYRKKLSKGKGRENDTAMPP